MAWELYEFGASATLVGTPGTTTAADGATWGQVTGLPGTPTFVLATHTFSADINLANTTPATWNAPWYKAGEYYLADDGSTDGAALALGFQNGVTATSAAPTGSDVTFPASGTGESITLGIKLT